MPYAGLGLHLIVAVICAIHAVRTGQPMYWLIILFMFPLLGSIVYIFAIYLPSSRLERNALQWYWRQRAEETRSRIERLPSSTSADTPPK